MHVGICVPIPGSEDRNSPGLALNLLSEGHFPLLLLMFNH